MWILSIILGLSIYAQSGEKIPPSCAKDYSSLAGKSAQYQAEFKKLLNKKNELGITFGFEPTAMSERQIKEELKKGFSLTNGPEFEQELSLLIGNIEKEFGVTVNPIKEKFKKGKFEFNGAEATVSIDSGCFEIQTPPFSTFQEIHFFPCYL